MFKKELEVASRAAREAGGILKRMYGKTGRISKKGEVDLVTDADLNSEKAILNIITKHFPEDNIIAEESGALEHSSKRVWLIDPLDGTTNFVHGFPFFAVSISLEVNGEIVAGVVFNPVTNEHFEAVKGSGSFLNKNRLKVSRVNALRESLLATGFPYYLRERPQRPLDLFTKMTLTAQGIRRAGSAALDLCYVAAGWLDGFWEEGLKPWDTAAGNIIVKEAGGTLSDYHNQLFTPYGNHIVASNGLIHEEMIRALKVTE